jgi:proline iminopeptidase
MFLSLLIAASLGLTAPLMGHESARSGALAQTPDPIAGEHRVVTSDGAQLYGKVAGDGPVCLYVHGGPGQGSASFERLGGSELEAFLTMIYLDQRGSGRSPDAADYSLDRMVADIEEVRSRLGVDQMCLIAHSFGGILAVEYARRHPDRVTRLVMAFSTLHFLSEQADRMQIDVVNEILGREVVTVGAGADRATVGAANEEARTALMASGQGYRFLTADPETTRLMAQVDGSYPRSRGYGRFVMAQIGTDTEYYGDYAPASADVPHPVLVIAGSQDYAIGPEEHLRYRFPNQTIVVLETGHMGYFDENAAFVAAVRAFLTGRPG